jgi:nucleotide-binding universal stress UspA family protein
VRTPTLTRILHANDGSDPAFHALSLALDIAKKTGAEVHMVCVEAIPYLPATIEEVREESGLAAWLLGASTASSAGRVRWLNNATCGLAKTPVLVGHPVRDIVNLARDIKAELLVVGASGHSALYDRMLGSRADRLVHLAPCPVLVVK